MNTQKFTDLNSLISLSAIHHRMVVYALNEQEELVHVDSVNRGKLCKCRCLSCGEALVARQGDLKSHSFAHESGAECLYAVETMLQWLAKELIVAHGFFITPELNIYESLSGPLRRIEAQENLDSSKVSINSARIEKRVTRTRPDLVLQANGRELLIEITISKKIDAKRLASIEQCQLSAVEINLSKTHLATVADFERILFTDNGYKQWLFNVKEVKIRNILRARNLEQLSLQDHEYKQKLIEEEALEAAKNRQQRETAEKNKAEENAHISDMLTAVLSQRPGLVLDRDDRKIYYRLKDGGLWFLWGQNDRLYLIAKNGNEQVIKVLRKIGLNYDEINLCYLALQSQYLSITHQLGFSS
ncbi:hypothetical protein [Collimonas pratensis]|uniref:Competence CoiA-like family protein n=1 Tax=Collimonas pratensis TaxID=279113 RepID=A0ABM5Z2I6_9BURK|nr:hypothetical protein [Collimonas pratensis]AMP13300.1 competence CoiA-like family protein [Collimonas pratensis]